MFPAEHEVGHHDEDRRQHGSTGGEIDGGVHHLLHGFRAEAVDHQHHEHEGKLPPGGAHRHAVLVELGGLLAVDPLRDLGEVDLHWGRGPHHHGTEHGDEQHHADEAAHQRLGEPKVLGHAGEDLHHAAGIGEALARHEHVHQQGTYRIHGADDDAGADDHLDEGLLAALHVIEVGRRRLGTARRLEDPAHDAQRRPVDGGSHRLQGDGLGRYMIATEGHQGAQHIDGEQGKHAVGHDLGNLAEPARPLGGDVGRRRKQHDGDDRGDHGREAVLIAQHGVGGVGDDVGQQGDEPEQVHEPVEKRAQIGHPGAERFFQPVVHARLGVFVGRDELGDDEDERDEVDQGRQQEDGSGAEPQLDVVVDDVAHVEHGGKGHRQQGELAYGAAYGFRHGVLQWTRAPRG